MGIQGLTRFLDSYRDKYEKTEYVRAGFLVVDGNNLMYHFRTLTRNGHLVGGDYVAYAKAARDYFQKLKSAQIIPIVLFDGAYEEAKWDTVLSRHQKTLKENVKGNIVPGNSYLPISAPLVFREILTEQRVAFFQTEFEADETIAFLAKRLNCPVLSSDSDFFLYPGLVSIPIPSAQFRKVTVKAGEPKVLALTANIVSLQEICKQEFKFTDQRLVPLAALVLGNDRIRKNTFINFLNRKTDDKIDRLTFIFKWGGKHSTYASLRKTMLMSVKESERAGVAEALDSALAGYSGEKGDERVWEAVARRFSLPVDEETEIQISTIPAVTSNSSASSSMPAWFPPAHLTSLLPTYLFQLLTNRTLVLGPQVEIHCLPSTHTVAIPIIQTTVGILLGPVTFTLISRQQSCQVKTEFQSLTHLPTFGPLPTIQEPGFQNRARALLDDLFTLTREQIEFLAEWPLPTKLVVMCLFYFLKRVRRRSAQPIAIGVLLSFLRPVFAANKGVNVNVNRPEASVNVNVNRPEASVNVKCQGMTKALDRFYARFEVMERFTKTNPYDIRLAYDYSQFQGILFHVMMLCKLLHNPLRPPLLSLLNSHLVYNFVKYADEARMDIQDLIDSSFGKGEGLSLALQKLVQLSDSKVEDSELDKVVYSDPDTDPEEVTEDEAETDDELNNRFSVLSM